MGSRRAHPRSDEPLPSLRGSLVTASLLCLMFALGVMSPPANALEPVTCDQLDISLSSEFANSICYRDRFSANDARGWYEQIRGENDRHLITVVSNRSTDSRTYVRSTSIDQLYERFSFPPEMKLQGEPQTTEQGFEFATVRAVGSTACFLFLRQETRRRGGFRAHQYGLFCDKSHESLYTARDVEALLSKIQFRE